MKNLYYAIQRSSYEPIKSHDQRMDDNGQNGNKPSYCSLGETSHNIDVNTAPEHTDYISISSAHSGGSSDDDLLPTDNNLTKDAKHDDKVSNTGSIYSLPPGHVPAYRAVFMISNAALGAGLLNFPEAYMKAGGIHVAITVQCVLLVFIVGAFLILARCASQFQAATYQDIVLLVLGNKFKNFIQTCIVVYFFGTCITYVIIIGEQLSSVLTLLTGQTGKWYTDQKILFVIFSLLFLLPLCIPRRLKALSYTSFFGGVGAVFITGIIVGNYFSGNYKPNPEDPILTTDWKSAFAALPVICFGFQCHVSSVVVHSELKDRNAAKFFWCALAAMIVCALTYSLCGSYGYATFGASTNPDILTNYATGDTLVNIARVCILLILLSSFAIQAFCARTVIDGVLVKIFKYGANAAEQTERRRRLCITFSWFLGVLSLALIVPNIGVAIAMISGIAALFIFVFPGLCLLKSVNLQKTVLKVKDIVLIVTSAIYILLGSFIFGLVTVLAIQQNVKMRHLS